MKWSRESLLISCVLLMFGCKKNIKPDYPNYIGCERFTGEYLMYDPDNEISYIMTCDCIPKNEQVDSDSLIFKNYANMFNFSQKTGYGFNNPGHFGGINSNPLMDKNGHNWAFSNIGYEGVNDRRNRIIGDSLYIQFSISNAAYYLGEGVSYSECNDCRHYGVKIH